MGSGQPIRVREFLLIYEAPRVLETKKGTEYLVTKVSKSETHECSVLSLIINVKCGQEP